LLYKATRDEFLASRFHQLCDDKGPTMTVVKSTEGWMFGGFTTQSWKGDHVYKTDPQAFMFTLTNPHNIPATKFSIKDDKHHLAINANQHYGPLFGVGHDLIIRDNSNKDTEWPSYTDFPGSYQDTTGKGNTLFTGSKDFTSLDIEVYTLTK